jgi:hypothetical protein
MMDRHALDKFLSTPAIYVPNMSDEEWQTELDQMLNRSILTHRFVDGLIAPGDYMDALDQFGVNPLQIADDWEEGRSCLF